MVNYKKKRKNPLLETPRLIATFLQDKLANKLGAQAALRAIIYCVQLGLFYYPTIPLFNIVVVDFLFFVRLLFFYQH